MARTRLGKVKTRNGDMVPLNPVDFEAKKASRASISDLQRRQVVTRQLGQRQTSETSPEEQTSPGEQYFSHDEKSRSRKASESAPEVNAGSKRASAFAPEVHTEQEPTLPNVDSEPTIDLYRASRALAANGKINLDQAINMLQQLRQRATPEELAVLHSALSPVQGTSNGSASQRRSAEDNITRDSIPPARRRSSLPPGLATRSGELDDHLTKPPPPLRTSKSAPKNREQWIHTKQAAEQHSSPPRSVTPSDLPHIGTHSSGTLRITNGSTSPTSTKAPAVQQVDTKAATPPQLPEIDTPNRLSFEMIRDRPTNIPEPRARTRPSKNLTVDSTESRIRSHSADRVPTKKFLDTPQPSQNGDSGSSLPNSPDAPRFRQRWSHRASHLPTDYRSSTDPYEVGSDTIADLREFATRLSAVWDVEDEGRGGGKSDSHADALSKLTGSPEVKETVPEWEVKATQGSGEQEDADRTAGLGSPAHSPRTAGCDYNSRLTNEIVSLLNGGPVLSTAHRAPDEEVAPSTTDAQRSAPVKETPQPRTSFSQPDTPMRNESAFDLSTPEPTKKKKSPLSLFKFRNRASKKKSCVSLNVEAANRPSISSAPVTSPMSLTSVNSASGTGRQSKKRLQKAAPERLRQQWRLQSERMESVDEYLSSPCITVGGDVERKPSDGGVSQISTDVPADDAPSDPTAVGQSLRRRGKSFGGMLNMQIRPLELAPDTRPSFTAPKHSRSFTVTAAAVRLFSTPKKSSRTANPAKDKQPTAPGTQTSGPAPARHSLSLALTSNPFVPSTEDLPQQKANSEQLVSDKEETSDPDQSSRNLSTSSEESQKPSPSEPSSTQTATPTPTPSTVRLIPIGASGSVEDLYPDWHGRPAAAAAVETSPEVPPQSYLSVSSQSTPRARRSFDDVPPLPELPADIHSRVIRADHIVTKRMRNSPRSSPLTPNFSQSARTSPVAADFSSAQQNTFLSSRTSSESQDSRRHGRSIPRHRMDYAPARSAMKRTPTSSGNEDEEKEVVVFHAPTVTTTTTTTHRHASRWSIDGPIPVSTLSPTQTNTSQPNWDNHPRHSPPELWRKRRSGSDGLRTLHISVNKADVGTSGLRSAPPIRDIYRSDSPSIVVSHYITPTSSNRNTRVEGEDGFSDVRRSSSAGARAETYMALFGEEKKKENCHPPAAGKGEGEGRMDSLVSSSTSTFSTSHGFDDNGLLDGEGSTTTNSTTTMATLAGVADVLGNMRNFKPYHPSQAVTAERSRALSMAATRRSGLNGGGRRDSLAMMGNGGERRGREGMF
ncbi:hypothetical protein TI39_contig608g00002 [Zymoseptoria brevis]|uniref:Uncharacterized protein n=1 Tax=Zymoseptoria brevis TaxID=1047168 RepID=A0A0F4GKE8_9PEZI|nr:hypothetical protein TI39_contig608g00002 [Zymoseptoria brevis]